MYSSPVLSRVELVDSLGLFGDGGRDRVFPLLFFGGGGGFVVPFWL